MRKHYLLISEKTSVRLEKTSLPPAIASLFEQIPERRRGGWRAGDSIFVAPEFVAGTLKHGFEFMSSLDDPISRAIYMMFLISDVHPFDDGNGRVARIMMNAELVHGGRTKIIIPTIYRDDYMLALKRLTRKSDPAPFVKMMDRASEYSHWLEPSDIEALQAQLQASNAFKEPDQDSTILKWK